MRIGDLLDYEGKRYILRGLDPMGVPDRRADLEDAETGAVDPGADLRARRRWGLTRGDGGYTEREALSMREMVIYGVSFDMVGKQPIVLLKTADGNRFLPIWIGHPEAAAILVKLQNAAPARPMTHDLLNDVVGQLDAEVISIAVTEMRENTYYARITLQRNGSEIEVDSRPSDAIALAVRSGAKIYVADDVIEESGVEFEGDASDDQIAAGAGVPPLADLDPEEFRAFLDTVSPDEFAADPEEG